MQEIDGLGREHALIGTWALLSWENVGADGQVSHPMGVDAVGYLIYSFDDRFSVTISRADRTRSAGGDLLGGTLEEKARAADGFVAYAGRYTFHGDHVVHHVELSLFPNWVGTDQRRSVELSTQVLILSAGPMLMAGREQVPRLTWRRVYRPPEAD
jgi:Lipocalin-like domain